MIKLKKGEALVYAGETALRAPDGTLLPSVPQFVIAAIDTAAPARVATVGKNERVVLAGHIYRHKQNAEERFAAMKAGRKVPPKEEKTAIYIITDAENIHPKTGLPIETGKALYAAGKDLAALISIQQRKEKAGRS